MSAKLIIALGAMGVTASAASVPTPLPCPMPAETTATTEPEGPQSEIPSVCSKLPACLEGVMVPNVAYNVAPAMYECAKLGDKCTGMKVWCEPKKEVVQAGQEFNFWYACEDMLAIPQEETCTVDGQNFTVGTAFKNVVVFGERVDYLWCLSTSKDDVVSCSGNDCGSTVALTPPGVQVQTKCIEPPKPAQCPTCEQCVFEGFFWSSALGCGAQCPPDHSIPCYSTPAECSVAAVANASNATAVSSL